ncbi:uncharacterized protein I303_107121 [Kwoniella dejecticola CBS 10117]|uniref:Uncharacterized protein n=1 Tax=Kwoniella dejecticola CBS 10117 TaxID=1296121 RepID=A0A1A5ZYT6_9TREE|nr:uncharacterized protein I303_06523 [Kwoniella dejecticola CBS 10117]OBR82965.1 hypothetical protein I303_06523 [Kwoniella dejecticola CBS 10117]
MSLSEQEYNAIDEFKIPASRLTYTTSPDIGVFGANYLDELVNAKMTAWLQRNPLASEEDKGEARHAITVSSAVFPIWTFVQGTISWKMHRSGGQSIMVPSSSEATQWQHRPRTSVMLELAKLSHTLQSTDESGSEQRQTDTTSLQRYHTLKYYMYEDAQTLFVSAYGRLLTEMAWAQHRRKGSTFLDETRIEREKQEMQSWWDKKLSEALVTVYDQSKPKWNVSTTQRQEFRRLHDRAFSLGSFTGLLDDLALLTRVELGRMDQNYPRIQPLYAEDIASSHEEDQLAQIQAAQSAE